MNILEIKSIFLHGMAGATVLEVGQTLRCYRANSTK